MDRKISIAIPAGRLAAAVAIAVWAIPVHAAEPAGPTQPTADFTRPTNDCQRLTGEQQTRCNRERGYGEANRGVAPVGNRGPAPTAPKDSIQIQR